MQQKKGPKDWGWIGNSVSLVVLITAVAAGSAFAQSGSGKDLYESKCVVCHGSDGSASTALGKSLKAADLRAPEVQKKSSAALAEFIATGKGNMPPFRGTLSDDEIHSVVAHLRTLAAKPAKKPAAKKTD